MKFALTILSLFVGVALSATIPRTLDNSLSIGNATFNIERDLSTYEVHHNGTLVERNPARLVKLASDVLKKGFKAIKDSLARDKSLRSDYTFRLIQELRSRHPEFNYVVCHTKHAYQWDGVRGVDWDHRHEEVDVKIGGTIGYEIYNARSGTFTRQGDGGFLNWAWGGNAVKVEDGGKRLVFAQP